MLGLLALLFGPRAFLLSRCSLLSRVVVLGPLSVRQAALNLLREFLDLLLAERLLDRRQEFLRLVAGVLAEQLSQLHNVGQERFMVPRKCVQLGELCAHLLDTAGGSGNKLLGIRMLLEGWKEMLLLQVRMTLELGLKLREQIFAGFQRTVRGFGERREQLIRFGRARLHQCS